MDPVMLEKIRQRAYDLWVADGCREGHDVADWLRAEAEVFEETALTAKARAPRKAAPKKASPALKAPKKAVKK
ncbi:MAG: hypothetical protein A2516_03710 [Alphaproteobacteria bacterium RIFOXYD12_FULL_60_8]|nr:MAG: hypothetical protein A2516_03710 [Alphaproteobacteria bacterium RIFOXYD12_FULL_60_8]